jgi:hypothetical protein
MALTAAEIAELVAQLETLAGAGGGVRDLRKALTDLSNIDLSSLEAAAAATSSRTTEITDAVRAQTLSNEASIASLQARERALRAEAEAAQGTAKEIEKQIEAKKASLELAREEQRVRGGTIANVRSQEEALNSLTEQQEELTQQSQQLKSIQQQLTSSGKELAGALFAGDEAGAKMLGSVKSLANGMGDLAVKKVASAKSLGKFAGGMAGALSLAIEFGKAIAKLALEVFNASAEFQKVTGTSQGFANSIVKNFDETRKFGGTLKDVSAAGQALTATFTDFTMTNESARDSIVKTGVALSKLGVSTQDFAKGIQLSTKALGQNGLEAEETQRELAALAMDIGVAPSKMASDFASAGPHLAKFGKDGTQAFKDLAVSAKITGIEVGRLLAITEKFDTFEGAAEQAGKLNAALGGNFVNAMELLMNENPVERFEMIRNAILDTGLSFDDMTYKQKNFYVSSLGLQDVGELALVMSGKMDTLNGNVGKTSEQFEDMAERAHTVQSFQEQLNALFADMVPLLLPIVETMQGFMSILSENRDVVKAIGVGLGIIAAGMAATAVATLATTAPLLLLAGVLAGIGYFLFQKTFASSFLDGLYKIGDGFSFIGDNIFMLMGPFGMLLKAGELLGDKLFKKDGLKMGIETTTKSIQQMDMATADAAATSRAAAPVIANNNVMSSAVSSAVTNTTNNIQREQQGRNIVVELDGKKVGEGVMGKFARSAAMV